MYHLNGKREGGMGKGKTHLSFIRRDGFTLLSSLFSINHIRK
jgi:hypothetical protein